MDLGLQAKAALVKGASSGIGATTATSLAEEGADVVVCYRRNLEGASRTADAVALAGRRSGLCQMDVGDVQDVASAMSRLRLDWIGWIS
jgi:NAD(P)-dependent dehydrogenase (short-subunit alcohol dehydrogenase family)